MLALRGPHYRVATELGEMQNILTMASSSKSDAAESSSLRSRTVIVPFLMMLVMMILQPMSGSDTVSYYSLDIFKRADVTSMNNHLLSMLVTSSITMGYVISTGLMRCVPRKIQFISSGLLMATSNAVLGFALYKNNAGDGVLLASANLRDLLWPWLWSWNWSCSLFITWRSLASKD